MKHLKTITLAVITSLFLLSCTSLITLSREHARLQSSVRQLLDEMDDNNDIERYEGSDVMVNLQRCCKKQMGRVVYDN